MVTHGILLMLSCLILDLSFYLFGMAVPFIFDKHKNILVSLFPPFKHYNLIVEILRQMVLISFS